MNQADKLRLLNFLVFLRGKLQSLSIELMAEGENHDAVDNREKQLADEIDRLRVVLMRQWQANAKSIMGDLQDLNSTAQRKIREMRSATNKAKKVTEVVNVFDEVLGLVRGIV